MNAETGGMNLGRSKSPYAKKPPWLNSITESPRIAIPDLYVFAAELEWFQGSV